MTALYILYRPCGTQAWPVKNKRCTALSRYCRSVRSATITMAAATKKQNIHCSPTGPSSPKAFVHASSVETPASCTTCVRRLRAVGIGHYCSRCWSQPVAPSPKVYGVPLECDTQPGHNQSTSNTTGVWTPSRIA